MVLEFIWFVWALSITLSSVVFGLVIYNYLKGRKIKKPDLENVRWIILFYILGLMFATIAASLLFIGSVL